MALTRSVHLPRLGARLVHVCMFSFFGPDTFEIPASWAWARLLARGVDSAARLPASEPPASLRVVLGGP